MLRAHMISHTHWDREWYQTRMQFLPRLVRLVDAVLDLAENDPDYLSFLFDAQTITLEDYLAIKPQNRERLGAAIRSGRIIIGPWYILPDEMLISGESHIRNFLTGDAVAAEFGGKMEIGYLPDSFGHPEQMPQILQGLGLDTSIFWRGAPNTLDKTEFYWLAPDGESQVLCVNMPLGYSTAARLGDDIERAVAQLDKAIDLLSPPASSEVLLLMNGSDHLLADRHVPAIVAAFNRRGDDRQLIFSTLPAFLEDLKAHLPGDLKTFSGPIYSGDKTILLGGTISTRMYLKQANHIVQKKLERYLEPVHAGEKLAGGTFDFLSYQKKLWKLVLENHPHDSICGCSIDALHEEMMTRFTCLEELEDTLLGDAVERRGTPGSAPVADAEFMLFEPTQDGLPQYLELDVRLDSRCVLSMDYPVPTTKAIPGELPPPPAAVRVEDEAGREIPAVLLSTRVERYDMRLADYDQPTVWECHIARVALLLPGLSYGSHALRLYKAEVPAPAVPQPPEASIENEFYTVAFDAATGSFTITDRKTGKTHVNAHRFVDMGDAGDEYTYSWPDTDRVYSLDAKGVSAVETSATSMAARLILRGTLSLPAALTADRSARGEALVACPFTVTVTLTQGIDRIDFDTELENLAKDHRLQVEFPVGALCTHASGSSAFAVTRSPIERPVPETWEEYPQSTALNHGFIDTGNDAYGLSIAAAGLTEYEAVNRAGETCLRLTLLRCVGWLSLAGLNTRRIHAGWQCETPGGQCLGTHRFQYAIAYHQGSWRQAGSYAMAERALHPVWAGQSFTALRQDDNPLAFLSTLPPLLRLSAVKPAEDGDGIILRLFSLAEEPQILQWQLPAAVQAAQLVNLAEKPLAAMQIDDQRRMTLAVGKGKIISIRLT